MTQNVLSASYHTTYKLIDRGLFEAVGPLGITQTTWAGGRMISSLQTGYVYHYAFIMLIGITGLLGLLGLSSFFPGIAFKLAVVMGVSTVVFEKILEVIFTYMRMVLTEEEKRKKDLRMKIIRIAVEAEVSVETATRWFEMYEFL